MSERIGQWMQTISGKQFWPLDPRPEDFDIEDIAHALSNVCRFGGHTKFFYTVAEHCVHVSKVCDPEHALEGLLHDATEAYIGDMVRPLKRSLPEYKVIENRIAEALARRFGLTYPWPHSVKKADEGVLMAEQRALLAPPPEPWTFEDHAPPLPSDVRIGGWSPDKARAGFICRFIELSAKRRGA